MRRAVGFGEEPLPPLLVAEGVDGLVELPELGSIYRSYAWILPIDPQRGTSVGRHGARRQGQSRTFRAPGEHDRQLLGVEGTARGARGRPGGVQRLRPAAAPHRRGGGCAPARLRGPRGDEAPARRGRGENTADVVRRPPLAARAGDRRRDGRARARRRDDRVDCRTWPRCPGRSPGWVAPERRSRPFGPFGRRPRARPRPGGCSSGDPVRSRSQWPCAFGTGRSQAGRHPRARRAGRRDRRRGAGRCGAGERSLGRWDGALSPPSPWPRCFHCGGRARANPRTGPSPGRAARAETIRSGPACVPLPRSQSRDTQGVAAAFLVVSLGLALFAETYRSTLVRGQADQAAFAFPADYVLRENPTSPVRLTDLATPAVLADTGTDPVAVVRRSGNVTGLNTGRGVNVLGLPASRVPEIDGWRGDFSGSSLDALARSVAPESRPRCGGRSCRRTRENSGSGLPEDRSRSWPASELLPEGSSCSTWAWWMGGRPFVRPSRLLRGAAASSR